MSTQSELSRKEKLLLIRQLLIRNIFNISIILIAFLAILTVHIYNDNNMFPALKPHTLLLADRLETPVRNDVVIYSIAGKMIVGRVIALGGDEIDITQEGQLIINSIPANEEIFYATFPSQKVTNINYPHVVAEGSYFILNDYRTDTNDSREFGDIPQEDIFGPLIYAIQWFFA